MGFPIHLALSILLPLTASAIFLNNPESVAGKQYDYIVVGGGLTGLTAAARLSANQRIHVLVIESGFYQSSRGPIVENITTFGQAFDTSLDHAFQTAPLNINGRQLTIHSGNGLGGSTLINGASYTSPAKVQIDSWESHLENTGWNWQNVSSYIHGIENVRTPTPEQVAAGYHFDPDCHGMHGEVHVGPRDSGTRYSPVIRALMKTVAKRGIPTQKDLNCGDPRGVSMLLNTIRANQTRADAARELLLPYRIRPNLSVLVGHKVGRVLFKNGTSPPTVMGVEFGTDGRKFEVYANNDVLLAAGALVSPLILEYSGIGLKSVLDKVGVPQIVDLPVGQNLQDQTTTSIQVSIDPKGGGQGQAVYFATWNEIFNETTRPTAQGLISSQLDQWAEDVVSNGGFGNTRALKAQLELYRHWIVDQDVPYAEIFMNMGSTAVEFAAWLLLPFTRGYIHILDKDPYLGKVTRNPRYFENDLDRYAQAAVSLLILELASDDPMQLYLSREILPGVAVPDNASVDDWITYNVQNFHSNFHAVGTCAMMAKDLGGVVDPSGRVYGVRNLRVIDASIVPTQISAHPSALLYGMAAKLSDIILADIGNSDS